MLERCAGADDKDEAQQGPRTSSVASPPAAVPAIRGVNKDKTAITGRMPT